MKKYIRNNIYLLVLLLGVTSCYKEAPELFKDSPVKIIFNDKVDVVSGSYPITDKVDLKINFEGVSVSSVRVVSVYDDESKDLGDLNVANNEALFSQAVKSLKQNAADVKVGNAIRLDFTVTTADGQTLYRSFTVNVKGLVTFNAANPTTSYNDSTFTIAYTIANLEGIEEVNIYTKINANGVETKIDTKDYAGATSAEDAIDIQMPAEGQVAFGDVMYIRIEVASSTGEIYSQTAKVTNSAVKLSQSDEVTLWNQILNDTDTPNSFDLREKATLTSDDDNTLKDILVNVVGNNLGFTVGVGNTTMFVKAPNNYSYDDANFQNARDTYNGGVPTNAVANIFVGEVYIAKVQDLMGSQQFVVFRVKSLLITPNDDQDNFTIEYKYK